MKTVDERFFGRINIQGDDDCWLWEGAKCKDDYGQIRINHKDKRVHRLMWEMVNGPIPDGYFICHHCDNPPCVNPKHLFLATPKQNSQDCVSKNRFKSNIGELNPRAKLTLEQVEEIRELYKRKKPTLISLAEIYKVSIQCIFRIVNYISWKSIPAS